MKRPRPEETAHVSDAPPAKKSMRSFLIAGTADLGKRANDYKLSRRGPNGEECGTWLRDFCIEEYGDVNGSLRNANEQRVKKSSPGV